MNVNKQWDTRNVGNVDKQPKMLNQRKNQIKFPYFKIIVQYDLKKIFIPFLTL